MIKGEPGTWYEDESVGGYFNAKGELVVLVEFGSDADFDKYSTQVQNGEGYYDDNGHYVSYGKD